MQHLRGADIRVTPDRTRILRMLTDHVYAAPILNNSHRGDIVEIMVLAALDPAWKHVGLGWHPWDLQLGTGRERVRLQVKQTAARQLWGLTKSRSLSFGWKAHPPAEFERYNPGEAIEREGWFCDGFVFGIHDETDPAKIDQVDPAQWQFMVVAAADLAPGTKTMQLSRARERWRAVPWDGLADEVARLVERVRAVNPL